ncbi:MAG TPA: ABC transporter ATP-binding protein [Chloroflexi bacterium]|nr:ABC transporter ATP-binding protein [Chloroflexota bacterium]
MAPKVLDVNDLQTRFHTQDGTVYAVNGVSFHVEEGETLGIVGESGCGKSVSVLSVMRLIPQPPGEVQAESIYFGDRDITKVSEDEMRDIRGSQIAMIFQDPMTSLNPVLTIGFQIMEPLRVHLGMSEDEARERAAELLHLVGIPEARARLDDYPHQFSGGMRQRAMIAMSLACNPALLIADEPTTALDVTIQAQIVDLVKRLRDQFGMSLIWITHDLGVVAGLADRVIVMYAGFIVEEAPIAEVYGNPRHPYTFALLKSLPRMDGSPGEKLMSIEGLPPENYEFPTGCPFAPRCMFVKDKCWQANPRLVDINSDHRIACWVDIETGELR